jgi:glutathione synthase/RimK-type ligase-like ATP-grasp enzyme
MKNILIPTKPDDQHAHFVNLALQSKGHQGTLWYTADFPELQTHTFEFQHELIRWQAKGTDFEVLDGQEFDVVWWRRPRRPVIPDFVHPEDIENANYENLEFYKTFWHIIAPDAYWVNPAWAAKESSCKLLQLKVARGLGLNVPATLISNDPPKIKEFILRNGFAKTIYKPLYPVAWFGKDEMRLTYTREINLNMLPEDKYLQTTAGIFQKKIEKEYELRVNIFGNTCVAAKLSSQDHPQGKEDWRKVPQNELSVEEYDLPESIFKQCKLFMRKFGIVFGCFDFIVSPAGEYYFLEINEQGQFLWIEDVNPEIKILDAFTEFLISGSDNFTWKKKSTTVSLQNYFNSMLKAKEIAINTHKRPATLY